MHKIKRIIRLSHEAVRSQREIACSCGQLGFALCCGNSPDFSSRSRAQSFGPMHCCKKEEEEGSCYVAEARPVLDCTESGQGGARLFLKEEWEG